MVGNAHPTGRLADASMSVMSGIAYAQARIQSRYGRRADAGVWLKLQNIHDLGSYLQTAQQTPLRHWVLGLSSSHNSHEIELALRQKYRHHIDEVAKCVRVKGNEYFFKTSRENKKYLIPKGSIGINGVSLTLKSVSDTIFSVSLVPFTLKSTTLDTVKIGSLVNIEYDYFAKILLARK